MLFLLLSLYIQLFDSEIKLNRDGSLDIREEITVNFDGGYHHGIYRDIPLELRGETGNYSLGFEVRNVLMDGNSVQVKQSKSRYGGGVDLRIRIGDPDMTISGIHIYTIEYSAKLGARYFDTWDELYWNVTGNRWEDKIDSLYCAVLFPSPVELTDEDIKIFVGLYGSDKIIKNYTLDSNSLFFGTATLYPGYGATVDIRFPKDFLIEPPLSATLSLKLKSYLGPLFAVLLPLSTLVLLFKRWYREGKDLPAGTITVKYIPPSDLTAAEVGTILDQKVGTVDITSVLFDLARMGYVSIEEIETDKFLFLKTKDYKIKILKDMELGEKHLREFLRGLSAIGGKEFLISDLKGEFYAYVKDVKEEIYNSVEEKGYFYGNPDNIRKVYFGFGLAALITGFMATLFLLPLFSTLITGLTGGIALGGLVTLCFAPAMPKRTYKGREALTEILGFREFLVRVEKERLKRMLEQNPTIFFDFLSYAIAIGVVDEWAERFSGLELMPPGWYSAYGIHGPIRTAYIASSIGDTINAFSAATSVPRSSSSGFSGGGGGGFSGGGGGGGGGGGW